VHSDYRDKVEPMNFRPMSQQEAARHHFVPQAVLAQPPSFFSSRGVAFRKGHDDLDEFEVAELSLDEKLPFALVRYRGTPWDETTIFLPSEYPLAEVPDLVRRITVAFGLAGSAVRWERSTSDTPF
jgi:hypothetical protein